MDKASAGAADGDGQRKAEARRAVLTAALIILVSLVAVGVYAWLSLGSTSLSGSGYVALALGILGALGLAVGLMTLVFFSNRYGYDEAAGGPNSTDAPS